MQIPRRVHPEVSAEGAVRGVTAAPGAGFPGTGAAEGVRDPGRAPDAGPCAHAARDPAEVCRGAGPGLPEGQERHPYRPHLCGPAAELRWAALLGPGLPGVHGGQGRGDGAKIHPRAGAGRPAPGSVGNVPWARAGLTGSNP